MHDCKLPKIIYLLYRTDSVKYIIDARVDMTLYISSTRTVNDNWKHPLRITASILTLIIEEMGAGAG